MRALITGINGMDGSHLADFLLDKRAQELADEAKASSTCIPIGEGENCW